MKANAFFETHPVFRLEEFAQFMRNAGTKRAASWWGLLSYHCKSGRLVRIRKSVFAAKPISVTAEEFWIDPYLVAGKASADAVLSHHTALELHNLAYTTFETLTFITSQAIKPFTYEGQRFRSVSIPKALIINDQITTNILSVQRQGISIKITDL